MHDPSQSRRIVLLAGGVGGARMARGLAAVLPPEALTIIVNVGDDERFYDLKVCPDLDTILYTLAGRVSAEHGWGVEADSTRALQTLMQLGAPTWMTLGDADFGLHIYRSWCLAQGERLTTIMRDVAQRFGVASALLPVSDGPVPTQIDTDDGWLSFQDWFVRQRAAPAVRGLRYSGAAAATITPEVAAALQNADAIVIAPSNPLLSIEPMLAIPALRSALCSPHRSARVPCVAVSPLINGRAVKGPLGQMLTDLGIPGSNIGIAQRYSGIIDALVIDQSDQHDEAALRGCGIDVLAVDTLIRQPAAAAALAQQMLDWLPHIARRMPMPTPEAT